MAGSIFAREIRHRLLQLALFFKRHGGFVSVNTTTTVKLKVVTRPLTLFPYLEATSEGDIRTVPSA